MKRLQIKVLSVLLAAILIMDLLPTYAVAVSVTHIVNFSNFGIEEIKSSKTFGTDEFFTVRASDSKHVSIEADNTSIDGFTFSKKLQLRGTGTETERSIVFAVSSAATVTVYGTAMASRTLSLYKSGESGQAVGSNAVDSTIKKLTYSIATAGTYYLKSESGGIDINYISVSEYDGSGGGDGGDCGDEIITLNADTNKYLYILDAGYIVSSTSIASPSTGTTGYTAHSGNYILSGGTSGAPIKAFVIVMGDHGGGANGRTITLDGLFLDVSNASANCAFELKNGANVNLLLEGANTLKSGFDRAGLQVPNGATIAIDVPAGQADDYGSLTASSYSFGAGIGGANNGAGGTITINGGTIDATGATYGAGIGGAGANSGAAGSGGTITINGGIITATGGSYAAGIGGGGTNGGAAGSGGTITINGGTIIATGGSYGAGIGGGGTISGTAGSGGTISITGGVVNASVTSFGAAIGGGGAIGGTSGAGGSITISGGTVTATGGFGISIGGGSTQSSTTSTSGAGGTVTISGGTVTATSRKAVVIGPGLGGSDVKGEDGTITITGGSVKADASKVSPHPKNDADTPVNVYPLTLTLEDIDEITAITGSTGLGSYGLNDVQTDAEGKLYFWFPVGIYKDVELNGQNLGTVDVPLTLTLDETANKYLYILDDGYVLSNASVASPNNTTPGYAAFNGSYILSGGTSDAPIKAFVIVMGDYVGGADGRYITLNGLFLNVHDGVQTNCAFELKSGANVSLLLSGENTLKSGVHHAGLHVPDGATITIDVPTEQNDSYGSLTATCYSGGAGIGGGKGEASGTITINGGTIIATGGSYGAGIGGGSEGAGGTITINDGIVTAVGGLYAAGIGGGGSGDGTAGSGGTIAITGGTVTATGGSKAAGIGGGDFAISGTGGAGGDITISGGTVTSTGGIGPGTSGADGTITITGGSVKADADKVSPQPTNGAGTPVYLTTLTLEEINAITATIDGSGIGSYGLNDVQTDAAGKLYFWLPATAQTITLTADGGEEYWAAVTVAENNNNAATLQVGQPPAPPSGDGGFGIVYYTVSFDTDGGSAVPSQTVARNRKVTRPDDPTRDGFTFAGWYSDAELTVEYDFTAAVTRKITIYAGWSEIAPAIPDSGVSELLITDVHIAYMRGKGDGTFAPHDNMTRAEVAQVFYNLLRDKDVENKAVFSDVAPDAWHETAVQALAALGVLRGYSDGTYRPHAAITRAEFVTIAMRFAYATEERVAFADVDEEYWAFEEIGMAAARGWVDGRGDDIFDPDAPITRAEAVIIVNRMLGRTADRLYIDTEDNLVRFFDVTPSDSAYYDITEAANAHDFEREDGAEKWVLR